MIYRSLRWLINTTKGRCLNKDIELDKMFNGVYIDSRLCNNNSLFVPINGSNVDGHSFSYKACELGAIITLWNKGVNNPPVDKMIVIEVDDTIDTLAVIAKQYASELNAKFIGVTGSNGKTSTKDMLKDVLASKYKVMKTMGNYNNILGVPLTLLSFDEDLEIGVVELGMDKLKEISYLVSLVKLDIAIITSIGDAHLSDLGSIENIAKAKCEIIEGIKDKGVLIHVDDKLIDNELNDLSKSIKFNFKVMTYGTENNNDLVLIDFMQDESGIRFSTDKIDNISVPLYGKHQAYNAMAVILCAMYFKMNNNEIVEAFKNVKCTKMRNEVLKINKLSILNDSYKSNPQSVLAALETMSHFKNDKHIVVLADMLDLGENEIQKHEQLGLDISSYEFAELITYGNLAKYINDKCHNNAIKKHYDNKQDIVEYLKTLLDKNYLVLIKGSRSMKLDEIVDQLLNSGGNINE